MKPSFHTWSGRFAWGSLLCAILGAGIFLFFPSQTIQTPLKELGLPASRLYGPLLFGTALGSLFFFLWARLGTLSVSGRETIAAFNIESKWLLALKLVLSAAIATYSLTNLNAPLDFDERETAVMMQAQPASVVFNPVLAKKFLPFHHNHMVALTSSYVTTNLFGTSPWTLRLPSFLFTVAFLVVLFFLTRHFSPVVTGLLYVHLALNPFFLWYTHSYKGYVSVLFFATLVLFSVYRILSEQPLKGLWLFLGVGLLGVSFSHTFGALFVLITLLSLSVWLNVKGPTLAPKVMESGKRLLVFAMLFAPVYVFVLLNHFSHIHSTTGKIVEGDTPLYLLGTLVGAPRAWFAKALFLYLLFVTFVQWRSRSQNLFQFHSLFVFVSMVFFVGLMWATDSWYSYARFYFAFLIPYLLWIAGSFDALATPLARRAGFLFVAVLFSVIPTLFRQEIWQSIWTHRDYGFYEFLQRTREVSSPVAKNCYSFDGSRFMTAWAREIYLSESRQENCERRFVLAFGEKREGPDTPHREALMMRGGVLYELSKDER